MPGLSARRATLKIYCVQNVVQYWWILKRGWIQYWISIDALPSFKKLSRVKLFKLTSQNWTRLWNLIGMHTSWDRLESIPMPIRVYCTQLFCRMCCALEWVCKRKCKYQHWYKSPPTSLTCNTSVTVTYRRPSHSQKNSYTFHIFSSIEAHSTRAWRE